MSALAKDDDGAPTSPPSIEPIKEVAPEAEAKRKGQSATTSAEDAAREYAWRWFEYHASQRQAVFRFFLLVSGALAAAYVTLAKSSPPSKATLAIGGLMAIAAFLFWRLDRRSKALIDLAEDYLKYEEKRLSILLGTETEPVPEIMLATNANRHRPKSAVEAVTTGAIFAQFTSFKQIYGWIFILVGVTGAVICFGLDEWLGATITQLNAGDLAMCGERFLLALGWCVDWALKALLVLLA